MNKEQILKIFKNKNNRIIFIIFIIGVLLVLTAQNHKDTGGESASVPASSVYTQDEEARLAEMLAQIEGAGRVSVMITYESGTEKSLAYETRTSRATRFSLLTKREPRRASRAAKGARTARRSRRAASRWWSRRCIRRLRGL